MKRTAFTLVELLVVVAIIALLLGILAPALGKARKLAQNTKCLTNLRNMQIAHHMYMTENNQQFIQVGLAHGGVHANEPIAWINTLSEYYGSQLLARSPVDTSPHWQTPVTGNQLRRTSYGVNDFLTDLPNGTANDHTSLNDIPRPADTVQFLIMAFTGSFAAADHVHAESWNTLGDSPEDAAVVAGGQVQINAYGGEANHPGAEAGYGYLDGHADAQPFHEIYASGNHNRMNPKTAQ
jgi:prepilin-type N-terminal cleavage/methylation domain-containing protein